MMERRQREELAKDLLNDKGARRTIMVGLAVLMVLGLILGMQVLEDWLKQSILRFAAFWGVYLLFVIFAVLFCVYDILKSLRDR